MPLITLFVRRRCIDPFIRRLQTDSTGNNSEMDFIRLRDVSLLRALERPPSCIASLREFHIVNGMVIVVG